MKRDEFFKNSLILGGTSLLPSSNVFSQSLKESGMDKLTDANGNFALQLLPYAETFLWIRRRSTYITPSIMVMQ
jgi:superoxide dismutase, Fe-Mn family